MNIPKTHLVKFCQKYFSLFSSITTDTIIFLNVSSCEIEKFYFVLYFADPVSILVFLAILNLFSSMSASQDV